MNPVGFSLDLANAVGNELDLVLSKYRSKIDDDILALAPPDSNLGIGRDKLKIRHCTDH